MRIEEIRELIKKSLAGHEEFVRQAEAGLRYYENNNDAYAVAFL